MEEKVVCATCGFEGAHRPDERMPSFWSGDCGWEPLEYVHHAVVQRRLGPRDIFDPRGHRNQGYQGSGKCEKADCEVCRIMRLHGV